MNTLDDTEKAKREAKQKIRDDRSSELKKRLNGIMLGESLRLSEYTYIQSLGRAGYIVVGTDKLDNVTSICHVPTKKL